MMKPVERVRLRVARTGAVSIMAQCSICARVSEHRISEATNRLIPCPTCGHRMDIRKAAIDAVESRLDEGPAGAAPGSSG